MHSNSLLQTPKSILKTSSTVKNEAFSLSVAKVRKKKPEPENDDNIFKTCYDEKLKGKIGI